jgi:hypothetical protein
MAKEKSVLALAKLFYADGEQFYCSEKEKAVLADIVDLFRKTQAARDQRFQYFDGQNLIEYIEDSVLRFNTNVDEREGIEDWQAAVNDGFTRNKVLAILGKIREVLPIATFTGRGDEDSQKGIILSTLYQYVEDMDDYEEFMTHYLLEAIVKGTAIGYEDVHYQNKKIRDVTGIGDDIKISEKNEKTTKLFASIVPLEEFYPSSPSIRKIKDMPYAFWRTVMPYSTFVEGFGHYRKSELVTPKQSFLDNEMKPYYYDFMDESTADGSVEVIRFYDKLNDQFVIIANGIWLNSIVTSDDSEEISPLPWSHKDLPFFDTKFDFFGSDFFYGKSLPDRLKSMQDILNVLTNMLLDQSFLTIFPPLLTNGFDSIEDDYLRPGRRTPVDTQGLPISQAFQVLQSPTPSGWHQYILEYTRQVMEEASIDKVSQGMAGAGDRTTAQEIRVAASGVAAMLQLFATMVHTAIKRKAMLKTSNILQFGMNPEAPIVRAVLGDSASEDLQRAFSIIKVDNSVLSQGKRGTRVIEMYKSKAELPTPSNVRARAKINKLESGNEVEIVAIPPTYLRNFEFDVKVVPNPASQSTKEVEKALQLEKLRVYLSFFPELVNKKELAAQTAEKMGDDPAKILLGEAFGIPPANENNPEMDPGMSTEPNGNTANNLARSARGGEQGSAEMAALMGNITG